MNSPSAERPWVRGQATLPPWLYRLLFLCFYLSGAAGLIYQISWVKSPPAGGSDLLPQGGIDLEKHIREQERAYLLAALERAEGVRTKAAELLGMSYRSFRHYAKKYRLI